MRLLSAFLIVLALGAPATAGDEPGFLSGVKNAANQLQLYLDYAGQTGERPDLSTPPVSDQFARTFDLHQLASLPPPAAGDVPWLIEWSNIASQAYKGIFLFGVPKGSTDLTPAAHNLVRYEDQIAVAMDFMVRLQAREVQSALLFKKSFAPAEWTPTREAGLQMAEHGSAELIQGSLVQAAGMKAANARLIAGALNDTAGVWAVFFSPDYRKEVVKQATEVQKQAKDGETQKNLAAFVGALAADN